MYRMSNNNNNKRAQRTPSQIIAETEARLSKLRIRQAKIDAKNTPEAQALLAQRNECLAFQREAKKLLGTGPQSAQVRIEKHEAWIAKIRQESLDAETTVQNMDLEILLIDEQLSALAAAQIPDGHSASAGA